MILLFNTFNYRQNYNDDNEDQEDQQVEVGGKNKGGADDLINYKGIYFNDDAGQKYTDPQNGAHFEFKDMCMRLTKMMIRR